MDKEMELRLMEVKTPDAIVPGIFFPAARLKGDVGDRLMFLECLGYLDRREISQVYDFRKVEGSVFWLTNKGCKMMDDCRRIRDLLTYLGMDSGQAKTQTGLDERNEFNSELDKIFLERLAFYSDRTSYIYLPMRDGRADLTGYPALERLAGMGLLDIRLWPNGLSAEPTPEQRFRITITDKGREALRQRRQRE